MIRVVIKCLHSVRVAMGWNIATLNKLGHGKGGSTGPRLKGLKGEERYHAYIYMCAWRLSHCLNKCNIMSMCKSFLNYGSSPRCMVKCTGWDGQW